nr:hypothetical protein [Streptomyces caniscabiei]
MLDQPHVRAAAAYWPAALAAGLLLTALTAACWLVARRTSGAVLTAGIGALVCTVYTADTSWRFAEHRLGMVDTAERLVMFAAGEVALLACAVMARANKRATATDDSAGTPGVPGVLVWAITGAQIIPAFSESGVWGGMVRAFFGPVMAGLLWHLAMGLEIRVTKPQALSSGLPAQIGAELRERLLSRLGLATRGRTAVQISRDRATARAVRLASRRWLSPWGRAALKSAVARSEAAIHGEQRHHLMQQLAGRRSAAELRTVPVTSPWVPRPVPEAYPRTPLGVTGAELRRLDPFDAVLRVHAAHPDSTPAELAELCTGYGVPVSETRVRVALRAADPPPVPERPQIEAAPEPVPGPADVPVPAVPEAPGLEYTARGLHLDIITTPQIHREVLCAVPAAMTRTRRTRAQVHARLPVEPEGPEYPVDLIRRSATEEHAATADRTQDRTAEPSVPGVPAVPASEVQPVPDPVPEPPGATGTDTEDPVLARAREVDAAHRRTHGRPAGIRVLKQELHVGQPKAKAIRALLDGDTR